MAFISQRLFSALFCSMLCANSVQAFSDYEKEAPPVPFEWLSSIFESEKEEASSDQEYADDILIEDVSFNQGYANDTFIKDVLKYSFDDASESNEVTTEEEKDAPLQTNYSDLEQNDDQSSDEMVENNVTTIVIEENSSEETVIPAVKNVGLEQNKEAVSLWCELKSLTMRKVLFIAAGVSLATWGAYELYTFIQKYIASQAPVEITEEQYAMVEQFKYALQEPKTAAIEQFDFSHLPTRLAEQMHVLKEEYRLLCHTYEAANDAQVLQDGIVSLQNTIDALLANAMLIEEQELIVLPDEHELETLLKQMLIEVSERE